MAKLVRFDWAAKKLLRSKANFGILEGFLSELLKEDIKIKSLLESESNIERMDMKSNRVDLLVENQSGELIIIEIQNTNADDYLQRILFGTSKLVVENLDKGMDYSHIKKVVSVSIVYFDLGLGDDYIYKGTTKFIGLNKHDELKLPDKVRELVARESISDLYPNYYIIKVNQFDDIAKDTLDQWIYFLKHEEIKGTFNAKGLIEAKKKLDIMRLSDKERREYEYYESEIRDQASMYLTYITNPKKIGFIEGKEEGLKEGKEEGLKEGIEKGIDQGIEIGVEKANIENARKMINAGIDIDTISTITGLKNEDIQKLK
jgi:predicted transposase/invertase (TIGR01784 family)